MVAEPRASARSGADGYILAEFLADVGRQLQPSASLNVAATLGARNFGGFGLRRIQVFGAALLPVGVIPFVLASPITPPLVAGLGSLTMDFRMGFPSTAAIVLIQDGVGWTERGAATASNLFFARNLGSTLKVAVLGAVLNASRACFLGRLIVGSPALPLSVFDPRVSLETRSPE